MSSSVNITAPVDLDDIMLALSHLPFDTIIKLIDELDENIGDPEFSHKLWDLAESSKKAWLEADEGSWEV